MKTSCVVVIGHVDHGKTSLVHALTGIETDRLPEEKERGLSIAPGFAHRSYSAGTIDFIDAPGHEDFIQAMISGATGARSALVVVSGVEGIGAQTLEHINIAGILGITSGIIVVTKSDLLSEVEKPARLDTIRKALLRTPFTNAQMVLCSALTGDGLDTLHNLLQNLLSYSADLSAPLKSFLPIDRVFSQPGHGTIVTGTLLGQGLADFDNVVLQPSGRAVTIRSLQSRGENRELIQVGERMAANLRGIAVTDVKRGMVLCSGGSGTPSKLFDVTLRLLPSVKTMLTHMEEVRVLFGSSNEIAQVRQFGAQTLAPSHSVFAQLRFKNNVVGFAGQRAIVRRLSPPETIGGAVFLDPQSTPARSGDTERFRILKAVQSRDSAKIANALCKAQCGVASLSDIARLSRVTPHSAGVTLSSKFTTIEKDVISSKKYIEACKSNVLRSLAVYHTQNPLHALAPKTAILSSSVSPILLTYVVTGLLKDGHIRQIDARFAIKSHDPIARLNEEQRTKMTALEIAFRVGGLSPPTPTSLPQDHLTKDLLKLLIDSGQLVSLKNVSLNQTLIFHNDTLTNAAAQLGTTFPYPQSFTTSQARTALATSRRVIVPVLEHFDAQDVTIRNGNARQVA